MWSIYENAGFIFHHFPFADIQVRSVSLIFQLPWTDVRLGLIPLDLGFWITTFFLLSCQAVINSLVAVITFEFLLPTCKNNFLVGYGIVVPALLLAPLWIGQYWQPPNITLMLTLMGAIPNILTLRVMEAMHGKLPAYCCNDRKMLCLYFSSTLLLLFRDGTPVPFTRKIFLQKLGHFLNVFVQTSLILSLLLANDYRVFPTHPFNIFYWGNLGNAFLLASLTSLLLDGGASGLGILTSCLTGHTLDSFCESPLTLSTSPSDFWGRRWDRPVQSTLRRGCYAPLRDSYSSAVAAFGTFVVSGFIHEYVLLTYSFRGGHSYQPRYGNQFIFFLWNGVVLMLERQWKGWTKDYRIKLPRPLQTALVLMTVLPIGNLFTDEYIRASFYDDASWGFPILVPVGRTHTSLHSFLQGTEM
jgi:hypothetical protein